MPTYRLWRRIWPPNRQGTCREGFETRWRIWHPAMGLCWPLRLVGDAGPGRVCGAAKEGANGWDGRLEGCLDGRWDDGVGTVDGMAGSHALRSTHERSARLRETGSRPLGRPCRRYAHRLLGL